MICCSPVRSIGFIGSVGQAVAVVVVCSPPCVCVDVGSLQFYACIRCALLLALLLLLVLLHGAAAGIDVLRKMWNTRVKQSHNVHRAL